MNKIINYLILVPSIFLVACEDQEISWEVEPVNQMLVVEGSFTDQLKKHQVILTLSEEYFANHSTSKVRDAVISITDGINTYEYTETTTPGVYETVDLVAGTAGSNYTLNIDLKSPINGTTHYYCSSLMEPTIKIDSMYAFLYKNKFSAGAEDIDSLIMAFVVFGQEPNTKGDYYTPEIFVNNTHLNDTIDEKIVYDDEAINGNYGSSNIFFFCNNVKPGDTVRLQLLSANREYFDFVTGVQKIAEYNDPLGFNGPPANAIGNIKGARALGYFTITSVGEGTSIVINGE